MQLEIERKFLVSGDGWRDQAPGIRYLQGYLSADPQRVVRVRSYEQRGFLTIKEGAQGITRREFEYEIPYTEASYLLDNVCLQPLVEKTRHRITMAELAWEIDQFHGVNSGLIIAEIELPTSDTSFDLPEWIGREVTDDPRYYNANLARNPYTAW
ncbi:MAG: CYTH domain-containing protein [Candidatus Delongbacteria bacterium]|nr:CYTH domain-containing protein [bacterium]MBL7033167.1 CYTH domain-containing protein [Candidatus Delongbacteria bacterium]